MAKATGGWDGCAVVEAVFNDKSGGFGAARSEAGSVCGNQFS